jgi:hypothetical protein
MMEEHICSQLFFKMFCCKSLCAFVIADWPYIVGVVVRFYDRE